VTSRALHARDYDPETGRWTTRDRLRLKGGLNVFAYVDGNPVNRTDSMGLEPDDAPFCSDPKDKCQKDCSKTRDKEVEQCKKTWGDAPQKDNCVADANTRESACRCDCDPKCGKAGP
jgi:uncharacterized protein RhaS with RHS repeats